MTAAELETPAVGRWAWWEIAGVTLVALAAFALRLHDLTLAPLATDNQDEMDWAWSGLGLLTKGVPYGWSNLHAYTGGTYLFFNGGPFWVVHPFLDHPPLFSLLVGGTAWVTGARQLTDVNLDNIRLVPITLAVVAIVLLYELGRRTLGRGPALLGVALVATGPVAVLLQRQAEAESLLAVLLLAALVCVERVLRGDGGRAWTTLLLACCLLAPLAKVSGIAVAGAAAIVLASAGHWRLAAAGAAAGVAGVAVFIAYGVVYDAGLFYRVLAESEQGRYGVMGAWAFLAAPAGPAGANSQTRDGWWLLGWLAAGWVIAAGRSAERELLAWPLLAYAVVLMLAAEKIQAYGWFRVAVYPLVYLLAARMTWRAATAPSAPALLAVLVLGGATATVALLGDTATGGLSPYVVAALLAAAVGPAVVAGAPGRGPAAAGIARQVAWLAVGVVLAANVATSLALAGVYTRL